MATTSRGTVQAATAVSGTAPDPKAAALIQEALARRSRPPKVSAKRSAKDGGRARFLTTDGVVGLHLKVAFLPEGALDKGDEERTTALLATKTRYVDFKRHAWFDDDGTTRRVGVLETDEAPLINWLRGRIVNGHQRGVREDFATLELTCKHCPFRYRNDESGHSAYLKHLFNEHPDTI